VQASRRIAFAIVGILNRIERVNPEQQPSREGRQPPTRAQERRLRITLDVGRNLVVGVVLIVLVAGIVILYARNDDGPARVLVDIFVALLSAGLGINAGERAGARQASQKLSE
jgi:hypothetical protein